MRFLIVPVFALGLIHGCQLIGSTGMAMLPTILIAALFSTTVIATCALVITKLKGV